MSQIVLKMGAFPLINTYQNHELVDVHQSSVVHGPTVPGVHTLYGTPVNALACVVIAIMFP